MLEDFISSGKQHQYIIMTQIILTLVASFMIMIGYFITTYGLNEMETNLGLYILMISIPSSIVGLVAFISYLRIKRFATGFFTLQLIVFSLVGLSFIFVIYRTYGLYVPSLFGAFTICLIGFGPRILFVLTNYQGRSIDFKELSKWKLFFLGIAIDGTIPIILGVIGGLIFFPIRIVELLIVITIYSFLSMYYYTKRVRNFIHLTSQTSSVSTK